MSGFSSQATEALLRALATPAVCKSLQQLNLRWSVDLESAGACQELAKLVASAGKLRELDIRGQKLGKSTVKVELAYANVSLGKRGSVKVIRSKGTVSPTRS